MMSVDDAVFMAMVLCFVALSALGLVWLEELGFISIRSVWEDDDAE